MSKCKPCPFCDIAQNPSHPRNVALNDYAFAIRDGYPITLGHSLIIPKRHIESFFATSEAEKQCLLELLEQAKAQLDVEFQPAGYNIGINDGLAAGQTIPHLHIHLIPRYQEEGKDPRGGVRWVIAEKADYWSRQ
ncbi:HIT family protein [Pseudomaricurvus alcaniphilus]|uniref:HIT family protein n=1 Tax=Pseudomaricurvus alcaniphilus TaxID=1166482 RepID=UPI003132B79F